MQNNSRSVLHPLWEVSKILLPIALLFIGWIWLLHFPWSWLFKVILFLDVLAVILVLFAEYQASSVNGAGGWMTFAFMILHLYAAVVIGIVRLLLWLWESVL